MTLLSRKINTGQSAKYHGNRQKAEVNAGDRYSNRKWQGC